ncbi:BQ2448_6250 [Microbotryum intermedium]|uniref:BQ2448_6250 protein n=1 Tax=Microbotryum intermedium TaxID=269621 RepID=A0A238FJ57_9BASI|nr:BQ2448_6250 [Microbotryum intermedium]
MGPAPFVLPGYAWDGFRFYKSLPGATGTFQPPPQADSESGSTSSTSSLSHSRRLKRAQKRHASHPRVRPPPKEDAGSTSRLRHMALLAPGQEALMTHDLECLTWRHYRSSSVVVPDCLMMDDSITAISFDDEDPSTARIGTQGGNISTGNLARPINPVGYYPHDEMGWRPSWVFASRITSLASCGSRFLATCLGPPAAAVVSQTKETISLASITLSPRKTSLWTSALSPSLLALGCDRKVLISRDPSHAAMDGYSTGGRHGDGAVFALDLGENMVLAGTRSGRVKIFDVRSTSSANGGTNQHDSTRPELQLSFESSITHIRKLSRPTGTFSEDPRQVLVATLDGHLQAHDLRFATSAPSENACPSTHKPSSRSLCMDLEGHVNTISRDLGLALFPRLPRGGRSSELGHHHAFEGSNSFVAMAGEDGYVRIWSLKTGRRIVASVTSDPSAPAELSASTSLLTRQFSEPIRAMAFGPPPPLSTPASMGMDASQRTRRLSKAWEDLNTLWVADGVALEAFRLH